MSVSEAEVGVRQAADHRTAQSRALCAQITRSAAKNFYHGLKLLPEPKRSAMYALYAYMRQVDDIADDDASLTVEQRLVELGKWREKTRQAINGTDDDTGIWPAFSEMTQRFAVPEDLFSSAIDGQCDDMRGEPIVTWAQLEEYCYRVAGVVGLASIYIWGFQGGQETKQLAIYRGVAFQLTNIIRDLLEDAGRGRVYFPQEELTAAKLTRQDILSSRTSPALTQFLAEQITRAQKYYDLSAPLESRISADSRPTLRAMTEIYHGILKKAAQDPSRVLRERISLSTLAKLRIAWRAVRSRK